MRLCSGIRSSARSDRPCQSRSRLRCGSASTCDRPSTRWIKAGVPMTTRIFATVSLVLALAVPVIAQRDPLASARDLYASARYDEALAVLNGMRPSVDAAVDRKSIEQYRSLCLLALGRGTEAEAAIAAVVTADPTFQPNES